MLSSSARQGVRILLWQLVAMILLTVAVGVVAGIRAGFSVLVGSGISLLASMYLVFVLIKHGLQPVRPATVLSLFGNWLVKTLLVLGLLMIALRSPSILPPALLMGLAANLLVYWLVMMGRGSAAGPDRVATSTTRRDESNG